MNEQEKLELAQMSDREKLAKARYYIRKCQEALAAELIVAKADLARIRRREIYERVVFLTVWTVVTGGLIMWLLT